MPKTINLSALTGKTAKTVLIPIELHYLICEGEAVHEPTKILSKVSNRQVPFKEWDNMMLLNQGQNKASMDTFMFWDDDKSERGFIYLGYWNDGVLA
jgi:hypothetical protein